MEIKFKFASKLQIDIDNLISIKDSPMHTLVQEIMMSSCPYSTNYAHQTNTINRSHIFNTSLQESDDDARINTTNKWDTSNIYTYTTSKWIIMDSKGKAPVQDYAQSKRLPMGRPFTMHEGASSRSEERRVGKECLE